MKANRQPLVCWVFDGLGCTFWLVAIYAYVQVTDLSALATDVATVGNPATTTRWLSMVSTYTGAMYLAPILGTMLLGFSAVVKQIAKASSI